MFFSSLLTLSFFSFSAKEWQPIPIVPWHEASIFQVNTDADPVVAEIVDRYLRRITPQGFSPQQQGIWIQSEWAILANHRGTIPAPAASLTKVATTIASLKTWDLDHRFLTRFYRVGEIQNGILQGDLIINTEGDPLFVWEEAIEVGNYLTELGIKKITGDIVLIGDWQMNYKTDTIVSGELFQQALNAEKWTATIERQYQTIEPLPNRPQINIAGQIKTADKQPHNAQLLFTHQSLTLTEILRQMNVYSNNFIAESLAQKIGGGQKVAQITAQVAQIPPEEILLINGSGLGVDNRISPRAASMMFMTLERILANTSINVSDLFPTTGIDIQGTIEDRNIPDGIAVKTGTLAVVSALAGTIYNVEREKVYFTFINYGNGIPTMRKNQDIVLQNLQDHWQLIPLNPNKSIEIQLGDSRRNLMTTP